MIILGFSRRLNLKKYPLTTAMLSEPKSKLVRGFSFFGVSFVYVIFENGTDIYWARSRVLEYLSFAAKRLPQEPAPLVIIFI
jgi:Cu(I)/Ag(I) efflux system membrane protein CusA/SilA